MAATTSTTSPICWICGAPADSREHRFKRSDLARSGKSWSPADQPFLVDSGGVRRIQGPGSKLVTFSKVLCQTCNTTRTQPYDRAYEQFSGWAAAQDAALMKRGEIDFSEVYGADYETQVPRLLWYFVKLFGCRIVDSGHPLPPPFATLFAAKDLVPFGVSFSLNATSFGGLSARGGGILGNYPIVGTYHTSTDEVGHQYVSGSIVGYIDVVYRYDYAALYPWEGDVIARAHQRVRLGRYDPSSKEPHISNGEAPGPTRKFRLGNEEVEVPLLSVEQLRHILSLPRPTPEMSIGEQLGTRIKIVEAILSPAYPHITAEYLRERLTLQLSDAIWRAAFPSI